MMTIFLPSFLSRGQEGPGHAGPSDNDNSKNGIPIYSLVSINLVNVTMSLEERSTF